MAGLLISIDIAIPGVEVAEIQKYTAIALALGLGWLIVPLVWIGRHRLSKQYLTANYWLAGWLIGPWLALSVAGVTGFLGDYNPQVKAFLRQPEIAAIVQKHSVNFVDLGGKIGVLLRFYTPHLGREVGHISDLSTASYAWVKSDIVDERSRYQFIGKLKDVQLVQVLQVDSSQIQK
jgi:hypothetical protein